MEGYANVDDAWSSEHYVLLHDFYARLPHHGVNSSAGLKALSDKDVRFAPVCHLCSGREVSDVAGVREPHPVKSGPTATLRHLYQVAPGAVSIALSRRTSNSLLS